MYYLSCSLFEPQLLRKSFIGNHHLVCTENRENVALSSLNQMLHLSLSGALVSINEFMVVNAG